MQSLKATRSIMEKKIMNKSGAKTQPCFMPFATSKLGKSSPFSTTMALMHAVIKGVNNRDKVMRTVDFKQDLPESRPVDGIECLR